MTILLEQTILGVVSPFCYGVGGGHGGVSANSGQTPMKCRDLACDIEPPLSKNCNNLTMEFQVKYLFPTSSSKTKFMYFSFP